MSEQQTTAAAAPATPAIKAELRTGSEVAAFMPANMEEAVRLSMNLADAGDMVPEAYRGRAPAVLAAIIKGAELGFAPMTALQYIAPINGRPSVWGDALPALIQRAGHSLDERIEGEGDDMRAICTLTRADGSTTTREFSVADAKRARLWDTRERVKKRGGNDTIPNTSPWYCYPRRMLQMRARGFACRDGAADVLLGIGVAEEQNDIPSATPRDVTPAETGLGMAQRFGSSAPDAAETTEVAEAEIVEPGEEAGDRDSFSDLIECWDQGVKVGRRGGAADENPYEAGTEEAANWEDGRVKGAEVEARSGDDPELVLE